MPFTTALTEPLPKRKAQRAKSLQDEALTGVYMTAIAHGIRTSVPPETQAQAKNPVVAEIVKHNTILAEVYSRVLNPNASPELLRSVILALAGAVKIHEYDEIVICEERLTDLLREL